ncbi:MAG: hypothetical protein JO078_13145 [Candidatus Eremiobacteraeota bacterium]|nr:hypothetical protein [Candidatus Eremiobacteraeota bacterium]
MLRLTCIVGAALVALRSLVASAAETQPAATPTPPPQIYRVVTRPLCAELHRTMAPAIGMMLQNDTTIKQSPKLFRQYNTAALYGDDAGSATKDPVAGDPGGVSNNSQNMVLLGMENLIRPIANNIIAIQTLLDKPELLHGTGRPDDDKRLREIREKLLKALAAQNASLDIISGFVDTQQMADLQHAGEAYISALSQTDQRGSTSTPSPISPLAANPGYAGLPPNPYTIDLATVPGLVVGYNPVTRLLDALNWTMDQTLSRENDAAKAVMASASLCGQTAQPH